MQIISDNIKTAIWEQISNEHFNATRYMYISAFLKNKGLDNLAKKFEEQYDEEIGHAKEFVGLLTDLNVPVSILEIKKSDLPIENISDIANIYLNIEIETSKNIREIKLLAIEEGSCVVEEFMRKMTVKQQTELEEAFSFLDKATLLPEWWQVVLWDLSL